MFSIPRLNPMIHELLAQRREDHGMTQREATEAINGNRWMKNADHASSGWLPNWEKPPHGKCYFGYKRRWAALCEVYGLRMIDLLDAAGLLGKHWYTFEGVAGSLDLEWEPIRKHSKATKKAA